MEAGFELFITTIARTALLEEENHAFDYWVSKFTRLLEWDDFDKLLGKVCKDIRFSKTKHFV